MVLLAVSGLMEEPEGQYPKNPCQPDIESHEIKGRMIQMGNVYVCCPG